MANLPFGKVLIYILCQWHLLVEPLLFCFWGSHPIYHVPQVRPPECRRKLGEHIFFKSFFNCYSITVVPVWTYIFLISPWDHELPRKCCHWGHFLRWLLRCMLQLPRLFLKHKGRTGKQEEACWKSDFDECYTLFFPGCTLKQPGWFDLTLHVSRGFEWQIALCKDGCSSSSHCIGFCATGSTHDKCPSRAPSRGGV